MSSSVATVTWRLGVGDPSLVGWLATAGYLFAFVLLLRAAAGSRRDSISRPWGSIAAVTGFLGLNKQLDLHALCIQLLREAAQHDGWYDGRRVLQRVFVGLSLAAFAVALAFWIRAHAPFLRAHLAVSAGLALLALYVALRLTVINHTIPVDSVAASILPVMELLGIASLTAGAATAPHRASLRRLLPSVANPSRPS